ncbi:MAG TPA: S-layer homology domain-containing protein [Clostridia bacterium]|nr:S-layer homology domain-containing protein [Clostridia bacterium]
MKTFRKSFSRFGFINIVLSAVVLCTEIFNPGNAALAAEIPAVVYNGDTQASAALGSMKYSDVGKNIWSAEAIYEAGALGVVHGYNGSGSRFGRTNAMTKEEAIATAYRAAGREAEAQQLGITINNARTAANKKKDPLEVLYDGFLQLAANEGLITAQNLADAFNTDQTTLTTDNFKRNSPAQRQEMLYWLAKTLNIQQAGPNQELLNYSDWRSVDPDKLGYIEAMLRNDIMTGSGGRINPKQSVTREQGAQLVKNAEGFILGALKYTKSSGVVKDIVLTKDYSGNVSVTGKNIFVTASDGNLVSIVTSAGTGTAAGAKNENVGTAVAGQKKELVVYKNGVTGDSSLLSKGDRVQYIANSSNTVKYVNVISNVNDVRYPAVQVNGIDRTNRLLNAVELFEMNYPDLNSISGDQFEWSNNEMTTYRIAPNASVTINGVKSDLTNVTDGVTAILTVDSNNLIKAIQCVDFGINTEARRIVRGIVEDNNPDLGYLTLYNEDGSGTGSGPLLRSYNYTDQNKTEILRNHKPVKADRLQAGDTAYIRLDEDGDIASVSAVDNYTTKYGKVVSKLPTQIAVEYEDGSQQILPAGNNVVVIRDKLLVGLKALKDGDRVRLLLNENGKSTDLKEITIEGDEHYITNIYKGTILRIDDMSDKIRVIGMQVFNKGRWDYTPINGATVVPFAEDFKIYSGDTVLDIEEANKLLYSNEAYIAVEKTYGGEEKAVVLSYRNSQDTLAPTVSDTIASAVSGSGSFVLSQENRKVGYSDGSIIVKYGRLVTGNSLSDNDAAYFALNRDYSSGDYYASVVKVDEPQTLSGPAVYRGRISAINTEKDLTLESFSELTGTDWKYSNTPKTLNITLDTRVLNDEGVLNISDFKGYGSDSYLQRTVYVIADGINALLISTAPYGIENLKGTVYSISDTGVSLRNASVYNAKTYMWEKCSDAEINILKNTVVLRGGRVINASEISNGDTVRVIKKDTTAGGDGYIIFVE